MQQFIENMVLFFSSKNNSLKIVARFYILVAIVLSWRVSNHNTFVHFSLGDHGRTLQPAVSLQLPESPQSRGRRGRRRRGALRRSSGRETRREVEPGVWRGVGLLLLDGAAVRGEGGRR